MNDKGMKTIDSQRVAGDDRQPRQRPRAKGVFDEGEQRHGADKHQRATIDIPGVGEITPPFQFMQGAARNSECGDDKNSRAQQRE